MNFKIKKINNKPAPEPEPKLKKNQKHITDRQEDHKEEKISSSTIEELQIKHSGKKFKISIGLSISLLIIIVLMVGIVKAMSSIDFKVFLKVAGDDLKKDAYGHTNFLILGTGNKNHEGADLTDTIMVASLDDERKLVSMVSIPRDLFIKDTQFGNEKINQIYYTAKKKFANSTQGLDAMKQEIEKFTGVPIHYWIKIDFDGFKDLIDAIGGIDVVVKKPIVDPFYPRGETKGYETFSISAGPQHLDGETALKYARSRKTTSDFDRADRQQQVINAIKEKATKTETLLSQEKISNILSTLKENIDTNISVKELLTLGSMAPDYKTDQIQHRLLHNDPSRCGGFLYNPPEALYYGMYVLIPADKMDLVHKYMDLSLNMPQIGAENSKIQILNGTKRAGAAIETKQILRRFCFDVTNSGNAINKNFTQTTYYYQQKLDKNGKPTNSKPQALDFLEKIIPGKESTDVPDEYLKASTNGPAAQQSTPGGAGFPANTDIIIELGTDYTSSPNYITDPFSGLVVYPTKAPTTTPATPGATPKPGAATPAAAKKTTPTPSPKPSPKSK